VWDLNTGRLLNTLEGHSDDISSVATSSDNSKIVSGTYDNTIKVWDLNTGRLLNTLEGHTSPVSSVAISSDNSKIVSGSDDCTLTVWDLNTGRLLNTLEGHSLPVSSVAVICKLNKKERDRCSLVDNKVSNSFPSPSVCQNFLCLLERITFIRGNSSINWIRSILLWINWHTV
jgi:WD40 repeat protein